MQRYRFVSWLGLAILTVTGCYPQTSTGPREAALRPVEVVPLHHESVSETLTLLGLTEPWQQTVLYFEVPGVVAELLVEEGDLVEATTPLVHLVPEDFQLAVAEAEAQVTAAEARLNLLQEGTRKEDLEAARAAHARATVRTAYWAAEYDRIKKLFQRNVISASELQQVQREHAAADQEQRLTKAELDRAVAGPRRQEIEAAAAESQARQQAAALARRQLDKATLRAPFRGRVEKRLVDVGTYINVFPTGGVPVVQLVDLGQIDAVVSVPEALLERLAAEPQIEIVSAVDPRVRARGKVIALGRVADPTTGTYPLRVRIPNPDGRFTAEMVVKAEMAGGAPRQAIRVPWTALQRAYGQAPYVLLVDPKESRVVARRVKLGPATGDRVEIAGGLSDGELLIVAGGDRVVEGDRVKVQRAPGAAAPRSRRPVP